MNRATRVALAAREIISEYESSYNRPLYALHGSHVRVPIELVTLVRLYDALWPERCAGTDEGAE